MKNLKRDSGMTKCIKKYPEIYDHADKVQRQITSFIKYLKSTSNVLNAMNAKNKIILYLTARSLRSLDKGGQERT